MLRNLDSASQAKLLGSIVLSVSLLAVAAALAYFAYTLTLVNKTVPAILAQVEQTLSKVDPVLAQIEATRQTVPPILDEIAALRKQIPPVLDEVTAVRRQIPPVLEEVAATRKALPPLVNSTAKSLHEASTTVNKLEPHIPAVLDEVRQTREALPGLMMRAENLLAGAKKAGQEASKGAVLGFFGGIITAPFKIIGGIGKGFSNAIGLTEERGFTEQDIKLAEEATNSAIRIGKIGAATSWENPENNNRGTVTLLEQRMQGEQACYVIHYQAISTSGKTHETDAEICQDKDGNWTQRE